MTSTGCGLDTQGESQGPRLGGTWWGQAAAQEPHRWMPTYGRCYEC